MLELNKVYHEDCLKFLSKLDDKSVNLIITDPPYNVTNNDWDKKGTKKEFMDWNNKWLKECHRVLKDNGSIYVFLNWKYVADLKLLMDNYFKIQNWIIWFHPSRGCNLKKFTPSHQDLLFYTKCDEYIFNEETILIPYEDSTLERAKYKGGGGEYINKRNGKIPFDVWIRPQLRGNSNIYLNKLEHPTQKPLDIIQRCVLASSNKGDLVLDIFMGSGTTAVASKHKGRNFIGCEINKEYVDIINERLKQRTLLPLAEKHEGGDALTSQR